MVNLYSEYDNSHTSFGGTGGILTRIGMDPAPCSEAEDLGRLYPNISYMGMFLV